MSSASLPSASPSPSSSPLLYGSPYSTKIPWNPGFFDRKTGALVVGLFGLPASGKSHLKEKLRAKEWKLSEGPAFREADQLGGLAGIWRRAPKDKAMVTVVAGCFTHPPQEKPPAGDQGDVVLDAIYVGRGARTPKPEQPAPKRRKGKGKGKGKDKMDDGDDDDADDFKEPKQEMTEEEIKQFTHIIYLHIPAYALGKLQRRRAARSLKYPEPFSIETLQRWEEEEMRLLWQLCLKNGIVFSVVNATDIDEALVQETFDKIMAWHRSLQLTTHFLVSKIPDSIRKRAQRSRTIMVLDADGTISPSDVNNLLWARDKEVPWRRDRPETWDPRKLLSWDVGPYADDLLKQIFQRGHRVRAYQQVQCLYENMLAFRGVAEINGMIRRKTDNVKLYPEFLDLLTKAAADKDVFVVVLTCGNAKAWKMILKKNNLNVPEVLLIGNNSPDGYIVTPHVKADVVDFLAGRVYGATRNPENTNPEGGCPNIIAFGGNVQDIPMMTRADQAILVLNRGPQKKLIDAIIDVLTEDDYASSASDNDDAENDPEHVKKAPVMKFRDTGFEDIDIRTAFYYSKMGQWTAPMDIVRRKMSAVKIRYPMRFPKAANWGTIEDERQEEEIIARGDEVEMMSLEEITRRALSLSENQGV